jgi:hypothetical protein
MSHFGEGLFMPIVQAKLSVSSECPFMIEGITTVITPVWQAENEDKESDKTPRLSEGHGLDAFNDLIGENTYDLLQAEGFSGARGKTFVLRVPANEKTPVRRFVLLGLGKAKDLSKDELRSAYEKAFKLAAGWDAPLRHVAASMPKPYDRFGGALFNEEDNKHTVAIEDIATAVASAVYSSTYVSGESKKPGKGFRLCSPLMRGVRLRKTWSTCPPILNAPKPWPMPPEQSQKARTAPSRWISSMMSRGLKKKCPASLKWRGVV